jgi:oligosaccharide repeat unit polymerase
MPLFIFEGYNVGLDTKTFPAHFIYTVCLTFAIIPVSISLRPENARTIPGPQVIPKTFATGAFALLSVSAAISFYSLSAFGNPYLAVNPEQARLNLEQLPGALATLSVLSLSIGSALVASIIAVKSGSGFGNFLRLLLLAVAMVAMALTGTRLVLIQSLVIFCSSYLGLRARRIGLLGIVSGAISLLALLGLIGQTRYVGGQISVFEAIGSRLSSGVQVSGLIMSEFKDENPWLGRALIVPFQTYLPGNQDGLGKILKSDLGLEFSGGGVSTPLPMEGFIDFGYIGIALYGLIAGILLVFCSNRIDRLQVGPVTKNAVRVTVGVTFATVVGGIGTMLAMYVVPLVLFLVFVFKLLKEPHSSVVPIESDKR